MVAYYLCRIGSIDWCVSPSVVEGGFGKAISVAPEPKSYFIQLT